MKTSRCAPEWNNRSSIYGMRPMPRNGVEKPAAQRSTRGVLKRLASAMSRAERRISGAGRSTLRTMVTPLVNRARYAANSKLAKFQAAVARTLSSKSVSPKGAGAVAQQVPAYRPEPLSAAQIDAFHHIAVADIRRLVTKFSADHSDVPTAVGEINEFSKNLRPSGIDLAGVTYDQVTTFLEKAQACDTTPLAPRARDFLLRAQSKAPETLETGPYVTYPAP